MHITPTTREEIEAFIIKAWAEANFGHYGKKVEWKEGKFTFKAEENGEVVGMISGKYTPGVLDVQELVVLESAQGKGIGKALLQKAEEVGRENGCHKAYLYTGKTWKAREFYEKLGYKKTGDMLNHHFHNDFVIYEKDL